MFFKISPKSAGLRSQKSSMNYGFKDKFLQKFSDNILQNMEIFAQLLLHLVFTKLLKESLVLDLPGGSNITDFYPLHIRISPIQRGTYQ